MNSEAAAKDPSSASVDDDEPKPEELSEEDKLYEKNMKDLDIKKWVSKPKYGREGEGVLFSMDFASHEDFVKKTDEQPEYSK